MDEGGGNWPGVGVGVYLMDLMPAVLILTAHGGMLVEKQLTAVGVAPDDRRVVQGREAIAVFIIRGGAKL